MTTHDMKYSFEIPIRGTNDGRKMWFIEQDTDAAVADNDKLRFHGVSGTADLHIISFTSASGQILNFDNYAIGGGSATLTVDSVVNAAGTASFGTLTTGTFQTNVKGVVLAKRN